MTERKKQGEGSPVAKKSMLLSTCDSCGKEEQHNLPRLKKSEYTLPPGWAHVQADVRKTTVFSLDMCDECFAPIRDLAGKHQRSRKTAEAAQKAVASSTSTNYHGQPDEQADDAPKPTKKAGKQVKETATRGPENEASEENQQDDKEPVTASS